jgi:large subunit ribosomal protein L38e
MPREITTEEEFLRIAKTAEECRVKKVQNVVKLKLRTKKQLYTFKTTPDKADELQQKLECSIVDV